MMNMKTAFTPGPWKVIGHRTHPCAFQISADDRVIIADVYDASGIANVRLIEAAPDMIRFIEDFMRLPESPSHHQIDNLELRATAIINAVDGNA